MAYIQSQPTPYVVRSLKTFASGAAHSLLGAIERANMRAAEREIARFTSVADARLSDETERRIERILLHKH